MKFNKKIIVPTLMSAVGISLVGSITGTVAWYQYSTRTTAAFVGTAARASHNLQIKINDTGHDYQPDLSVSDIATYLATSSSTNSNVLPITTGAQLKNAALSNFYGNPVYEYVDMANWLPALAKDYIVLPLKVKLFLPDDSGVANKKVYISELEIKNHATSAPTADISDAIRVQFSTATCQALFAKTATSTTTHGELDMNGDGEVDKEGFIYTDDPTLDTRTAYDYGSKLNGADLSSSTNFQTSYSAADATLFPNDDNAQLVIADTNLELGTTNTDGELAITVTIWLEGWHTLDSKNCWDLSTVGQQFDVGMRFCVDAYNHA